MSMSVQYAHLVAVLVECVIYGLYLPLAMVTLYLIVSRPRESGISKTMVSFLLTAWTLCTLHVAASMQLVFDAFIFNAEAPETVIDEETNPLNILRNVVQACAVNLGDSLFIYRCYLVWGRDWRVIVLPILLLSTSTITSVVIAKIQSTTGTGPFDPTLLIAIPLFAATGFATNLYLSGMIILRLWTAGRELHTHLSAPSPYRRVIKIIAESGSIIPLNHLFIIVLYATKSAATHIPVTALTTISSLAPVIIILLAHLGLSQTETSITTPGMHMSGTIPQFRQARIRRTRSASSGMSLSTSTCPELQYQSRDADIIHAVELPKLRDSTASIDLGDRPESDVVHGTKHPTFITEQDMEGRIRNRLSIQSEV